LTLAGTIGVIVTIGPDAELTRERASAVAEQEGPKFEGWTVFRARCSCGNDETGTVTNTYVWDSEQAARAFFTPELKAKVIEFYGAEPHMQFAEVSARSQASDEESRADGQAALPRGPPAAYR
jgi:hypothetical protein